MKTPLIAALLASAFLSACLDEQKTNTPLEVPTALTSADYDRASALLPQNSRKLAYRLSIRPNWIGESDRFWYIREQAEGYDYMFVDPAEGVRRSLFDHERLKQAFEDQHDIEVDASEFGLSTLDVQDDALEFNMQGSHWRLTLADYSLVKSDIPSTERGTSPDGKWLAFRKEENLFLRNLETGDEKQITTDGIEGFGYAAPLINPRSLINGRISNPDEFTTVYWSPDSKKVAFYRIDKREAGKLTLVESSPKSGGTRPNQYDYVYALSGEEKVPFADAYIANIETDTLVKMALDPIPVLYYGGPYFNWNADSETAVIRQPERGYKAIRLIAIDADDGSSKVLIDDNQDDFVDYYAHQWNPVEETGEHYWSSFIDGWQHLVRYDPKTDEVTPITSGNWRYRYIARLGEEDGSIYFVAGGKEAGRDPYYRHLYRTDRDGSEPVLLTPEALDHGVDVSPTGTYFVDNMSEMNVPTRTVLRSGVDGAILMELETAQADALFATGFQMAEPFEAVAADGKTPIYGAIYRPSNFDPNKSYPVIDNIYTGPHYVMTRKSFSRSVRTEAMAIAELGFIVVHIDGRGTNQRSKAFLVEAYKNLGQTGYKDHEVAIRQLAEKYPYMDADRVGVYGFSAGGYDTARVMFTMPDFYKVGVAASGNHDHRSDKAVWNEQWMGFPAGSHYDRDSNLTVAGNLKGKLFLAHGELDENVNPMATLQLVDKLIAANKDFEFLIVPGYGHFLDDSPYFQRRRFDFFVKHLMGGTPPQRYEIKFED
ncbi:DPP IV N-terminal domain-containing protein [Kordiimonas sp. SCSIO 12603]|uniref:S9 family peptidase n=1 Tax=Kordiimonas sp. SCSIO 12603 TaxID=2829596 RepID=UPI002107AAED|nr:DPP IV N-terminal domain-containing protein [Kordiimonas sp. SCSIO 12603]UTW59383.1 DPP IV N-terminal domain-containing protein [Kordiimonas sp. SCSIO 12603]